MNKKIIIIVSTVLAVLLIAIVLFLFFRGTEIKIDVSTNDDQRIEIAGVEVTIDGENKKTTGDDGSVKFTIRVKEGMVLKVTAKKAGQIQDSVKLLTISKTDIMEKSAQVTFVFVPPPEPLVPSISTTLDSGIAPFQASFNSSVANSNGRNVTYRWDFGDGGTSSEPNPVYIFQTAGTYHVKLTVADETGMSATSNIKEINVASETSSEEIIIDNISATPNNGVFPLSVSLSASAHTISNKPLTYTWELGDGERAHGAQVNHTYQTPNAFNAVLSVSNGTKRKNRTITINVTKPVPPIQIESILTQPSTVEEQVAIAFSPIVKNISGLVSYNWDFGDGKRSTIGNPRHAYTAANTYTVRLTVSDSRNIPTSKTVTVVITPMKRTPQLSLQIESLVANPSVGEVQTPIEFTVITKNSNGTVSYDWDFGDGSKSTISNPSHTYTVPKTYTVNLTVNDGKNKATFKSFSLVVNPKTNSSCVERLNQAKILYDKSDFVKVEDILGMITEEQCSNIDLYKSILWKRGEAFFARAKYREAAPLAEKALKLDQSDPYLLYFRALIEQQLGNYNKATELFDVAESYIGPYVQEANRWEFKGNCEYGKALNLYLKWLGAAQNQKSKLCLDAISAFDDFIQLYCGSKSHPKCDEAKQKREEVNRSC